DSCGVISSIHEQSGDINQGVERAVAEEQGAGDQGMMFGYATNETHNYMPLTLELSQLLLIELAKIRKQTNLMPYLRPDAKSQVTVEYDEKNHPVRVHTIVLSTQHDEFAKTDAEMQAKIKEDVENILLPRVMEHLNEKEKALFHGDLKLFVNPTGRFVIGGPHGDTGLTGRKIIVDTYGGRGAHGGGAFSGKDPSKVDRSAAYAARHIAKNLVAAGVAEQALVQVAYAIGVAEPVSLCVNTYGTALVALSDAEISEKVKKIFDMRPYMIEQRLELRKPIYKETAAYGHFGRPYETKPKTFQSRYDGKKIEVEVELFTWEKLDYVEKVKEAFHIK
ncbi:MAG: methionine adenosyltransferase, partial [Bacteroidales bacterium]|nr:methionine adenosyltransferase [Bacteroidales bacterium]